MGEYDYIEIRVPAKSQYVSVIRLTISGLATRIGFSYDEIEDLKIAADEAVTNVVHHAYNENEEGEIVIGCALIRIIKLRLWLRTMGIALTLKK